MDEFERFGWETCILLNTLSPFLCCIMEQNLVVKELKPLQSSPNSPLK